MLKNLTPQSYIVNGHKYLRIRVHLRDTVQTNPAQPHAQQTGPAETTDSSISYNAIQDNGASSQSLPAQNSTMLSSVDSVTPPRSTQVTRTRSERFVKPNTLLKEFV